MKCPFCSNTYKTEAGLRNHLEAKHGVGNSDKKTKRGRPSKYKEEFVKAIEDFFSEEPFEVLYEEHYFQNGEVKYKKPHIMPKKLPTIEEFARHIGVSYVTVYDWVDEKSERYKPEFSKAFTRARRTQKNFIIQGGLAGAYNPVFAKFVAMNLTDMRDRVEVPTDKDGNEVYVAGFKFVSNETDSKKDGKKEKS